MRNSPHSAIAREAGACSRMKPAALTGTVADIADDVLLMRAVRSARSDQHGRGKHPRWVAVAEKFGLGSTYAHQLCRRFRLDPDEQVRR